MEQSCKSLLYNIPPPPDPSVCKAAEIIFQGELGEGELSTVVQEGEWVFDYTYEVKFKGAWFGIKDFTMYHHIGVYNIQDVITFDLSRCSRYPHYNTCKYPVRPEPPTRKKVYGYDHRRYVNNTKRKRV